jgi:alkanesulfonate monooxygenase SsuD/methylene tetrahydromethanopterin reductase-like flavin-dependent oxidoreductase (luciferase family)
VDSFSKITNLKSKIGFGFCLPIFANPSVGMFRTPGYAEVDAGSALRLGVLAEQLGYHSLWVADHLMLGHDAAILEGWTTLAALAGMTQRARLGIIHYNNALRHPALSAKMAATLDQISQGRLIHFVDYGNRPYEYLAYGLHADDTREERIAQMCEGLDLTLALWSSPQPVTFAGRYYQTREAVCAPPPMQQPHPPIWIGEAHPEILDATARYAQGWNTTPVTLDELRLRLKRLDEACMRVGRDSRTLEKSLEIQVLLAPDAAALRAKLQKLLALAPASETPDPELVEYLEGRRDALPDFIAAGWLAGTPEQVRQRVRDYADAGIAHFLLWFVDAPDDSGLRLFAEQVLPHFAA